MRQPPGHDEVIGRVYDAVEGGGSLEDVLRALAQQFGAEEARLVVVERGAVVEELSSATSHGGELAQSITRESLSCDAPSGGDRTVAVTLTWARGAGGSGADVARDLAALVTHLGRALRLRQRLRACASEIEDRRLALDAVAGCVLVVDRGGVIRCASRAAEELLGRRDGLVARNGRLTAADAGEARALAAAIAEVASRADRPQEERTERRASIAQISRRDGAPIAVVLHPLPSRGEGPRRQQDARVRVVLHDQDRITRLDPTVVAELHRLTPTEAELAVEVAEGGTLAEFAIHRGCSELTARTHMKRILSKTGAARQADLVRMLVSAAAALPFG